MKPNIGILETHLQGVSEELNKLLADEVVLYIKARNYHWNIEGINFSEMHQFYEQHFNDLDEIMDQVAERIRAVGHYTEARLADYLKLTNLIENDYTNSQENQLKYLLESHETIINNLRRLIPLFADKHKDLGSSDFVTQLLGKHEKMAWMVRAYLG
ncbi:DNA starvation/stationary phase protection protein [Ferruginibacter paludis]|uniref:Dps family protein n=1 Tax=Ferruginibacter paludis TaxID=1310417 RepID=UPI0025B55D2C|nr:DNA starvation/stationary phase protection protein [Ferruginibacter paludis]MDN3656103.1 DNA starvation/stationary phase protection protein [Ferruginibacter paludis]